MKRNAFFIIVLGLLVTGFFIARVTAAPAPSITVAVNGKLVNFPDQKPYIDQNNRTLVPVRFPAETLGANVDWVPATQEVVIKQEAHGKLPKAHIVARIGQKDVMVNMQTKYMDTVAVLTNNRTMVPIRFISEYLGAEVKWWDASKTVHVFTQGQTEAEQQKIMEEVAKQVPAQPAQPINPVKPNQPVQPNAPRGYTIHDDKLEAMYKWFEDKGYKVGLPKYTNCTNDYGTIRVYCNKAANNKEQFDKDVYDQAVAYLGQEAGNWVKAELNTCERPDAYVWNQVKFFGKIYIAVVMHRDGEIFVEFDGSEAK